MKMRKGFTLVELLIVIVIIGILAAAMLLSSGSATDSADASNIITDLRTLVSASQMLYADNMDEILLGNFVPDIDMLAKYTSNPQKYTTDAGYSIEVNADPDVGVPQWAVKYSGPTIERAGVQEKLAGRSKSVGVYSEQTCQEIYASGPQAFMPAR